MTNEEKFFEEEFYVQLERSIKNAAWDAAGKIVDFFKEAIYEKSRGNWPDTAAARNVSDDFWQNARSAHAKKIISDVSIDIKTYVNTRIAEEINKHAS